MSAACNTRFFFFSKVLLPESLARSEWLIRIGTRFTLTVFIYLIKNILFMSFHFKVFNYKHLTLSFNHLSIPGKKNVLKTGPDRPVRLSTGHKTGPVQCKKPFLIEPVVEPANSHNFFFLYFKLKRCRFDSFYTETMSFYLELENL